MKDASERAASKNTVNQDERKREIVGKVKNVNHKTIRENILVDDVDGGGDHCQIHGEDFM